MQPTPRHPFRSPLAHLVSLVAAALGLVTGCAAPEPAAPVDADLLIRHGRVIDGSGSPGVMADVAVSGGRITAIGTLDHLRAARTIDARGQVVAPGFIDVHAHIEQGLFANPSAHNYVHDGVTTVITGNCGGSADSLSAFFARIGKGGASINVASLVGHNTVRRQVLGLANRAPTPDEQRRMEALVERAMREGAVGVSTGLIYLPGMYSGSDEVVGLARAAAKHRGLYASHIRDEGNKVVDALNEALDIGRAAQLPVQISHFKVSAPANWGRSRETLALIERARAGGLDVTIDQYPYAASSTTLDVLLPDWAMEGGRAEARRRLADPALHRRIAGEIVAQARRNQRPDFSYAVVARHATDPALDGLSITAINREKKGRPATLEAEVETLLDLIVAGSAQMVFHGMNEDDVRAILRYPHNMVGADGGVQDGRGLPHPRSYGTNARILGHYVREERLIMLEEAVRRMTSLAAQRFQLKDRGLLRAGYAADIVVFDPQRVIDTATYANPHQFPRGIGHVVVNGQVVVDNGRHTGVRSGVALMGPGVSAGR